jgi:hypothetical protein
MTRPNFIYSYNLVCVSRENNKIWKLIQRKTFRRDGAKRDKRVRSAVLRIPHPTSPNITT